MRYGIKNRLFEMMAKLNYFFVMTGGTEPASSAAESKETSGTIFLLVCGPDLELSHCIGPKYKYYEDYMEKAVKNEHGDLSYWFEKTYSVMAVISNEYDNTDDIIEWITSNMITLPSYFANYGEDDFYPDFISDENYRTQLTYDI